jgi:hypothetical protein
MFSSTISMAYLGIKEVFNDIEGFDSNEAANGSSSDP